MPTRPTPRIPRRACAALLVLVLLLSGCGTDTTRPAAPVLTPLARTSPAPTGIWLPTSTPRPPTTTPRPSPTTPPPPTRTPRPPILHTILTPPATGHPLVGTWGDAYVKPAGYGDNPIRLTSNANGGWIRFVCNHGNFPPLVVDAQGRFDVTGTYVREQAFPEPETPAPVATRYQGYLTGSTLVLTMTWLYPGSPEPPYTYKLPFVSMDPIGGEWPLCA
jgi:hypothetical protein